MISSDKIALVNLNLEIVREMQRIQQTASNVMAEALMDRAIFNLDRLLPKEKVK